MVEVYCHAIFTVREGRIAEVRYTGETDAIMAPNAYCAPVVRGCVDKAKEGDASPSITPAVTPRPATEAPQ